MTILVNVYQRLKHWTRFVGLILCIGFAFAAAESPANEPVKNIIFILTDDQRFDELGFVNPVLETPNMDKLAKQGVHFENTFVTTALCSPSRATILTGQYMHSHGVVDNNKPAKEGSVYFPAYLQEAGYETAFIGKWHMGEGNDKPRPGFDWFVSHKGQGKYFDTEWNVNGFRHETPKGYYTTVVTDYCLAWLKQRAPNTPWSLCLGHKAPHSFYFPEPKYEHTFDNVTIRYPDSAFHLETQPRHRNGLLLTSNPSSSRQEQNLRG